MGTKVKAGHTYNECNFVSVLIGSRPPVSGLLLTSLRASRVLTMSTLEDGKEMDFASNEKHRNKLRCVYGRECDFQAARQLCS